MSEQNVRTTTRRDALRLLAAGVAGGTLLPSLLSAASRDAEHDAHGVRRIERIGLQLYTMRTAMTKDLEGTIAAIAAAGITELEFAGYYDKDPAWWKATLKKHGLTAPSTHIGIPPTDAGWDPLLATAKAMGHDWVVMPYVQPGEYKTRDAWKRLADRLNVAAQKTNAAGMRFAYHNHDFEFIPIDGTNGFEILSSQTDKATMKFELDIYWAVKAGKDPLQIMSSMPGRVTCVHVKDAGPLPDRKMLDVGAGTIDFKGIIARGRTMGLEHWFMEHDNPADPVAFIKASAAAMKKL